MVRSKGALIIKNYLFLDLQTYLLVHSKLLVKEMYDKAILLASLSFSPPCPTKKEWDEV